MGITRICFGMYNFSLFHFRIYVVIATYIDSFYFWISAAGDMKAIPCFRALYVPELNWFFK